MKPDEICAAYRAELARLYGEERARKSRIDYARGWYYVIVAKCFPDGSVGTGGRVASAYRKKDVLEFIKDLKARHPAQHH